MQMSAVFVKMWSCPPLSWIPSIQQGDLWDLRFSPGFSLFLPQQEIPGELPTSGGDPLFQESDSQREHKHLSRVSSFFQKGLQDQTFRRGLIADASVIWGLMQKRGVRAGAGPNSRWCWASRSPHGQGSQCEHMRENFLEVSLIVQGLLGVMFRQLLSIFPLLSFL